MADVAIQSHRRFTEGFMRTRLLLVSYISLLVLPNRAGANEISKDSVKSMQESLRSQQLFLRTSPNRSRTLYTPAEDNPAYLVYWNGKFVPPTKPIPIQVDKLTGDSEGIELRVASKTLGRASIRIYPVFGNELTESDLNTLLNLVLASTEAAAADSLVASSVVSRVAHVRGSNHAPAPRNLVSFPTLPAAEAAGYRACAACWRPNPLISDFDIENRLGTTWSAEVLRLYPYEPSDSLHRLLGAAGKKVLSSWPVPLRGYSYTFSAVRSDAPNAFACPAGRIFVTTALLQSIETPEELELVLAHEVAHVERRHGYRQFKRATRGAWIGALAGLAIGAASGSSSTADLAVIMARLAIVGVLAGYAQAEETEADSYALAFVAAQMEPDGVSRGRSILSKLQFWSSVAAVPEREFDAFSGHPPIQNRVNKASASKLAMFRDATFSGFDSDGNLVATARLESQSFAEYVEASPKPRERGSKPLIGSGREDGVTLKDIRELELFLSLETTLDLRDRAKVSEIRLLTSAGAVQLDNKEDTEIFPGDQAGMNFVSFDARGLLTEKVEGIELDLPGVARWIRDRSP